MLRLAVLSGRGRLGTFTGALVALVASSALVMAGAMPREAARLAGHPGRVDAIAVLPAPGFDAARLRAAGRGAAVLTGDARGKAEYPELQQARTTLIAVTASF